MPQADGVTFAAALRRLRGELTLRELARRACCSKSTVWDLEHGRRSPTAPIALGLDKALGAGGTLVSLAGAQRQRFSLEAARKTPDGAVDDLPREWDDVWRRDFLKSTAAASAAMAAGLGTGQGSAAAGGRELMDAHIALRAAHGRLDNLRGAPAVYAQAVDHHQQVLAWHATAQTAAERRRIAALAADTGGFVGFLTYDLGMAENAAALYRDAAAWTKQAGDLSSCVNLIGQMSRILADQGRCRRALALAGSALHLAGTKAHPAVRSWLHAVRAHQHACLGDARAAQTDLTTAWNLLERADDGEKPPYIGYLGSAELGKWTGHTMARLGHNAPSFLSTGKTAVDESRAAWPPTMVRGSAELLTVSARIYSACGDLDAAANLASRSIAVATATGSARNLRAALTAQAMVASRA
jgi:transcriptional regulator with XRE-family HTH domain